jgi:hypothetical protein
MDDIEIFSLHDKEEEEGSSQESSVSEESISVCTFVPPASIGDDDDQNDTDSHVTLSQDEATYSSPVHLPDDKITEIPKEALRIHLDSPNSQLKFGTTTDDGDGDDRIENDHQLSSGSTTTGHDEEESSDVDSLVGRYDGRSRFPAVGLIEDDDECRCCSVGEDSKEKHSQKVEEEVVPWWIDFVRKECLGEGDESVAFDPTQDFVIESDSVVSGKDSFDETDEVAEPSHHDDASDSNDASEEIDWQERLWNAARQHYFHDEGPEELDLETAEDVDAATLVASFDRFDGNRYQIARFQQQLRICLDAYVEVFHDSPLDELEYDGDDEPPISFINAPSSDVQLSPFVPLDHGTDSVAVGSFKFGPRAIRRKTSKEGDSPCCVSFSTSKHTVGTSGPGKGGRSGRFGNAIGPFSAFALACPGPYGTRSVASEP